MPFEPSITTGPTFEVAGRLIPYPEALARMEERVAAIRAGQAGELVWLLEHQPLYPAGTSARADDLVAPARFPVFRTRRGGQWTYHGPGQRVVYLMLDLTRRHGMVAPQDVRAFVHGIEEWMILALARLGLVAERRAGRIGLWVVEEGREEKVAALGVHVRGWASSHGVAINLAPDLSHFGGIVPCGIREHGVTSLAARGINATMADLDAALIAAWPEVFGQA
ncbi:MAG: lipoyl(octanoyl) transferase LipB [Acetobacteraceae bacterium]